ncbi:hypothetical protein Krac_1056 [Ktedonobacter racemifer DSM 44963]|uniref:Uncharacterized protein n=1 Tax=Ktedonobacter racemifer DSM 44963 TaxID=485913 RepID=D6U643_KTERA|nr:hypothetical protein Krac_1056 [Ktedonobacter racemifer DSM 44963]
MISKQFGNNAISLNTNGGGEEVVAWIATTRRICGLVYVFTPRINLRSRIL